MGLFIGIVLGDVKIGIIMGVILELVFIGLFLVGVLIFFDVVIGGILGMVFVIIVGVGMEMVFLLGLLIVMLILILKNIYLGFLILIMNYKVDSYVEEGNYKGVEYMYLFVGFGFFLMFGVVVMVLYMVGSNMIGNLFNKIFDFV